MKKRFILIIAGLALGLATAAWADSASTTGSAPDRVGRWDFGIWGAGAFNDEIEDSGYVGGGVSYGVTPYIGLGVEAGWQEADTDGNNQESVGAVPVLFDIFLRIPTVHETVVPYGVLGLGAMGVYVTNEDGTRQGDDIDDTGFAWKLGGGIDWFINSNWILNGELAFWSADADLPTTSLAGNDDFDFWTLGGGLKYAF